jgi:hypothetical protein
VYGPFANTPKACLFVEGNIVFGRFGLDGDTVSTSLLNAPMKQGLADAKSRCTKVNGEVVEVEKRALMISGELENGALQSETAYFCSRSSSA